MSLSLRIIALVAIAVCTLPRFASAESAKSKSAGSSLQVVDRSLMPSYNMDLAVIGASDLEDFGDTKTAEFGGTWQVAYFKNVLESDIDMNLGGDLTLFTDSTDASLPSQLGRFVFDSGATWYYVNDSALEIRAKPGFNTDMKEVDGDSFYVPFSMAVMKAFDPQYSGILGLELRPGYERSVMPIMALGWKPDDRLHVKAGLPESRVTYYASPKVVPYLGLDWNSVTYRLHEGGEMDRDELTLEDVRLFAGLRFSITEELQFVSELGKVFDRKFDFDHATEGVPEDVSADDSVLMRFALLGPF